MQNSIRQTITIIFLSILSFQCISTKITLNDQNQLDPNFAGYNGTVLIIRNYDNKTGYNAIDRAILKGFKNYYKGEFLMIKQQELPNYSDVNKYRFIIKSGFTSVPTGGVGSIRQPYSSFYMKDRITNKEFQTKEYPNVKALEKFPMVLEALRVSK